MTAYNDLIDLHSSDDIDFCDIDQEGINDLIATYIYHKYSQEHKEKIIDFLSISSDKLADFLVGKEKSDEEKLKAYDEFHSHLIENLIEHFGNDIDDDLDISHDRYHSKEAYEDNQADIEIKRVKETGCFMKNIMRQQYALYDLKRKTYRKAMELLEKNELCQKA